MGSSGSQSFSGDTGMTWTPASPREPGRWRERVKERGKTLDRLEHVVRSLMAIGAQQAAIRAVIASALAEQVSESGQSVDALVAIRRAEAIIKALELAGYEVKPRT